MPAAAVLFDLDGTLLDTLDDIADSMNAVLERMGLPPRDRDAYRRFVGDGVETLVQRALAGTSRGSRAVEEAVAQLKREYAGRWDRRTRPYAGIPELLDGLRERGIRLAVFSNKPHEFTVLCVERLLSPWDFEVVLGARPDLPRKPDPAGALRIARTMGIEPSDFLYCGDTNTDMRTATAAGMFAVGAAWGFRDERELRASGAAAVVHEPCDLLLLTGPA